MVPKVIALAFTYVNGIFPDTIVIEYGKHVKIVLVSVHPKECPSLSFSPD